MTHILIEVNIIDKKNQYINISKLKIYSSISVMKTKPQELIVCNHFKLVRKLGTGAFGQIYLAENKNNTNEKYAAKLQEVNSKFPQLFFQAKMYKYLWNTTNAVGIPKVRAVTTEGNYNIMLMDLLGVSIEDIFVASNKIMSLKSALMLGYQMMERIEFLHERQIIHRDIKPDNFLLGLNNNSHLLYIVDFGLSKKYIKDNKHIPYKEGKQLTGTARYASITTHMGIQQSRRDDIQSIGYVIMYLLKGVLPWQNMKAKDTKTKYKMIMEKKISTPAEVLCKGYPTELSSFIQYARNIKFEDKPDYSYLKNLLKTAMKSQNIEMDYVYDWSKKTSKNITEKQPPKSQQVFHQQIIKRQSVKQQKSKLQDSKDKQRIVSHLTQNKNSMMSKNKTSNLITNAHVNNNTHKSKEFPSNQPAFASLMGQKLAGPKIATIKR